MPKFHKRIEVPGSSAADLYRKVSTELKASLAKAGIKDAKVHEGARTCSFEVEHAMIAGTIRCLEGAIELDARLSLLAVPFRSKIESWLEAWGSKAGKGGSRRLSGNA